MLKFLAPILVFGLVIFVHELGHFLAAKAVGVYAPRFSIGFGPTLWRRRRGETEYVLAALPLGGYVRMASRHDEDVAFLEGGSEDATAKKEEDPDYDPNALRPFGPHPVPANRLFESKPLWARLFILIAGVTMNVLLAFVVLMVLALGYGPEVPTTRVIGMVEPLAGAPAISQLHPGDTISRVNGVAVENWWAVTQGIRRSKGEVSITTNRGEVKVPLAAQGGPTGSQVASALDFYVPPVMDSVVPGDRAAAAGLQRGDSVVAVGGTPVVGWRDLVNAISASPERPITVEVARDGQRRSVVVTPKGVEARDPRTGEKTTVGRIGVAVSPKIPTTKISFTFGESVAAGAQGTFAIASEVVSVVKKLFTGRLSVSQLGGPIAITRASVEAARGGLEQLFGLIALLSVNVAVLNMLPIPILDGGQILLNVVESAKGSPFSVRTREYILRFGLVAIALLFATVMYNDTKDGVVKVFGWIARLFG